MKKLIIASCAVALATVANAATMTWGSASPLLNPDGSEAAGEEFITMYLWNIDKDTYDGFADKGASAVSAAVWNNYKANLGSANKSYADDGSGEISISDGNTYATGDKAYAAIIFAYDEGDDDGITYYKGNVGTWEFAANVDKVINGMDSLVFGSVVGTQALGWTKIEEPGPEPIPEPFSGTLALLGMGAIALRRKMKKAKKA